MPALHAADASGAESEYDAEKAYAHVRIASDDSHSRHQRLAGPRPRRSCRSLPRCLEPLEFFSQRWPFSALPADYQRPLAVVTLAIAPLLVVVVLLASLLRSAGMEPPLHAYSSATARPAAFAVNNGTATIHTHPAALSSALSSAASSSISSTAPPASSKPFSKAIVVASYREQSTDWIHKLSREWNVVRYVADDPHAQYSVPRNFGREAMAYLTYIIDHYDNLPDAMVFVHGHERAWHQVEPLQWKVDALNLTALERDGFIALRCTLPVYCHREHYWNMNHPTVAQNEPVHRALPRFWQFMDLQKLLPDDDHISDNAGFPALVAGPSGGQFAVSRAAVRRRSRGWWIRYRSPLLGLPQPMHLDFSSYTYGLCYEKTWHIAFGKPAFYCPNEIECHQRQWSRGVLCTGYPTKPLGAHYRSAPDDIRCWRNKNTSIDWQYLPWTLANYTAEGNPRPSNVHQPITDIVWPG